MLAESKKGLQRAKSVKSSAGKRSGMLDFIQQVVGGVALGCVYGLIALGFVLIYKATEVVNFAQGDLMMLGGFFAYAFIDQLGFNYWVGFACAVLAMAAFGSLVERVIVRPILGYPQFSIVMVTIGLGFALRAIVGMIWGTDDLRIDTPFSSGVLHVGSLVLAYDKLSIIVATVLLCGVLWLYFNRTRMGIAMQATSQNMLGAYYMGIPVKRVFSLIWAISAAVAGFAGVLLAPIAFIHTNIGFLGLKAFPAAVLGGFGSIPGALAGGLIIGIAETLSGFYLPEGFKDVAAYILLLVVLMVRPQGLFGLNLRKKV
jgi:branched-chain amino acid transport system permease protein